MAAATKAEQKAAIQSALHEAALSLAKTPGVHTDELSARIQRLKEVYEGVIYPDVTSDSKSDSK